jgi:S-adenosylmethionine hydrolase
LFQSFSAALIEEVAIDVKIITLLTDFGSRDGYPAIMKGVILGIAPRVQIVDITHEVAPQDVREGAFTLARCAPWFLPGSVHVAVVDPGVGGARRALAARLGEQFFVAPDNGLISLVYHQAVFSGAVIEMVQLDRPQFWLPQVSRSFHGRDVFAPVAAHLVSGVPLIELGSPLNDPVLLSIPQPVQTSTGWRGEVIHIDHFGNLTCNLRRQHLAGLAQPVLQAAGRSAPLVQAYADVQPGQLAALLDSDGWLSLAVVNGSAAQMLGAKVGDLVELGDAGTTDNHR